MLFNNRLTKRLTTTKYNKDSGLLRIYWDEIKPKEGLDHPMYLIKKLEQSKNEKLIELSTLIKKQVKLLKSNSLNPSYIYLIISNKMRINRPSLNYFQKWEGEFEDFVKAMAQNHKYIMGHYFEIRNDETTKFITKRKQFCHMMTEKLVNFLGYSMQGF